MNRKLLYIFLILSIIYASFAIFYKVKFWGFDANPYKKENLWTIEAHINFQPIENENIQITLTTPSTTKEYKVLQEDIVAEGYKNQKKNGKIILTSKAQQSIQDIYYKVLLFDNVYDKGKKFVKKPNKPEKPILEEQQLTIAKKLIELSKQEKGNPAEQLIKLINKTPARREQPHHQ